MAVLIAAWMVQPRPAAAQTSRDQGLALGDELPVPPAAVLVGEEHQVAAPNSCSDDFGRTGQEHIREAARRSVGT